MMADQSVMMIRPGVITGWDNKGTVLMARIVRARIRFKLVMAPVLK